MRARYGLFFLIVFLLRITCAQAATDLEPIVVSKKKVQPLTVYSRQASEMPDLPADSFLETLNPLPLDLESRSPKAGIQSDFSLRGSGFQGVLMLINGQRINDPQTGHHNCDIPLTSEDIKRVEIIPGASSALFGPDAIGGLVNILLKKPDMPGMFLELKGGQYKTGSGLFSITEKRGNLGARLSLEAEESRGFHEDTDFKKYVASLNSSLDASWGALNINAGYLEKEFGAYDFYTPGSGYPSKEWTRTWLVNSEAILEPAGFTFKPSLLWRRHFDKFMLDKSQQRSNYLSHHRTDMITPALYLNRQAGILGQAGAGIEYGRETINSTSLAKHNRGHQSIFLDQNKELGERISLGLSLRRDDFEGFSAFYTGSAALSYKAFSAGRFHLGLSQTSRIPSFTELYYNDPTTEGNSSLSGGKSLNYQLGYDFNREGASAGVSLFYRRDKEAIDWVKSNPAQAKWKAENITKAGVSGGEIYFKNRLNRWLDIQANYSYADKRIDDDGYLYKYGLNYTRHLANTSLFLNLPFGVQALTFNYKKKPGRNGWLLVNTRLSYRPRKEIRFFVDISNIFNCEYQEIEGIPSPGRWVEAGISWEH